jgi:hypothetical protein
LNHLIDRADVPAWQTGSKVTGITTHRTTPAAAQALREEGFRLETASSDARFGRGFYSSTVSRSEFGTASVTVAVRLLSPLGPAPYLDIEEAIQDLITSIEVEDPRAALLQAGYDGVVIEWGPGDTEVVAFFPEQVKVVRDGGPQR